MQKGASYIATMGPPGTMTADELLRLNQSGKRTELVQGRLVVRDPAGYRHGRVVARLAKVLAFREHVARV